MHAMIGDRQVRANEEQGDVVGVLLGLDVMYSYLCVVVQKIAVCSIHA